MKKKVIIISIIFLLITIFFEIKVYAIELTAQGAILIDYSSGKTLYEKNSNEKLYLASLTKVLTAIIVVENCDINEIATVNQTAIDSVEYGYVTANLKVGEEIKVEELLNVLLIASSNDVAEVLAEHIAGNETTFVNMMNEKAKEIGCTNSNFINASGVHSENHYSTAHDLALIARYAMQNEIIATIVDKTRFVLSNTNNYTSSERIFSTTNELIMTGSGNYYKYASGIKTGFTTPAGQCLMAYAEKNEEKIIGVVLKSTTSDSRYSDIKLLFDWGFDNYTVVKVAKAGDIAQTISVKNATKDTEKLNLSLVDGIEILVKDTDSGNKIEPKIELDKNIKAPISIGTILGKITYEVDGIQYTTNLIASQEVRKTNLFMYLIILFFLIVAVLIILRIIKNKKRKNFWEEIKTIK